MARRTLDDEDSLEALATGDLDFDQLMAQSGVKRLGRGTTKKPKSTPAPAAKKKTAPKTPVAAVAPPLTKTARSAAQERAQAYAARTEQLEETLDQERKEQKTARARIAELEGRCDGLETELREARAALRRASGHLDEHRDRPSLGELLQSRGLEGLDARGAAVRALVDAHRWEELAALLEVVDKTAARAILDAHVVLHCGRADCPLSPHAARVPVAEERCDLCGGRGQAGMLRYITDTCMLAGVTRLGIRGGPPAQLRILQAGLDRRVEVLRGDRASEGQVQIAWNLDAAGVRVDGGLAALGDALDAWSRTQ